MPQQEQRPEASMLGSANHLWFLHQYTDSEMVHSKTIIPDCHRNICSCHLYLNIIVYFMSCYPTSLSIPSLIISLFGIAA